MVFVCGGCLQVESVGSSAWEEPRLHMRSTGDSPICTCMLLANKNPGKLVPSQMSRAGQLVTVDPRNECRQRQVVAD